MTPLFLRSIFARLRSWWFRGVFCACFVLLERFVKLRETAIEQESLQVAYSFLNNYFRSLSLARPHPYYTRGARLTDDENTTFYIKTTYATTMANCNTDHCMKKHTFGDINLPGIADTRDSQGTTGTSNSPLKAHLRDLHT